ncbi:myrosinase 1-like isoform X1 [Onthophagus taurus]|uniref:myrosinase 1-like isoform X1 n=2 Tax=Onthophagus taurus TaxID=166361 RepID=UPI0039BE84C8
MTVFNNKTSTFLIIVIVLNIANSIIFNGTLNQKEFPPGFQFGVATSAYQIEGGWNTNGKGENIWDYLTHNYPNKISDNSSGDIACDSYNKFKEDVRMAKSLGVNFYRFSLSWTRILSSGFPNSLNPDGIRYYNELIDEVIANDITPIVTLFHYDLPQTFQELGGLSNGILVDYFVDFARIVFRNFGDRVKMWITINDPLLMCRYCYGGMFGLLSPPFPNQSAVADYLCAKTLIQSHVKIYHLYNEEFRNFQGGQIGYTINSYWYEPKSNSHEDIEAAERMFEFYTGLYAQPIFGDGDWPTIAKERVGTISKSQNFSKSRLPDFTTQEITENTKSADFLGLNYYFATLVQHRNPKVENIPIEYDYDAGISYRDEADEGYVVGPQGLRKILSKLKEKYSDIPIYITENGLGNTDKSLKDYDRANYYLTYLSACLDAIYDDKVNLVGYAAWSLMDNFEWMMGYTTYFGLYDVDFNDPNRPRTRKLSGDVYADVVKNNKLPAKCLDVPDRSSFTTYNITLIVVLLSLLYVFLISK